MLNETKDDVGFCLIARDAFHVRDIQRARHVRWLSVTSTRSGIRGGVVRRCVAMQTPTVNLTLLKPASRSCFCTASRHESCVIRSTCHCSSGKTVFASL